MWKIISKSLHYCMDYLVWFGLCVPLFIDWYSYITNLTPLLPKLSLSRSCADIFAIRLFGDRFSLTQTWIFSYLVPFFWCWLSLYLIRLLIKLRPVIILISDVDSDINSGLSSILHNLPSNQAHAHLLHLLIVQLVRVLHSDSEAGLIYSYTWTHLVKIPCYIYFVK